MVKKRIVTFKSVEVPAAEEPLPDADVLGATDPSATDPLPLTGSDPKPLIAAGLLMILLGVLIARGGHRDPRKLLIVALIIFTACVDSGSDQASGPSPSPTVEDKVKGTRFDRRDKNNGENGPGENVAESATTTTLPFAPEGEPDPTEVADPPTDTTATITEQPTVTSIVRQVRFETVPADLSEEQLASRDGDNFVTLEWDESAGLKGAASSVQLVQDAPVEIMTNMAEKNGALDVDVVMRNLQEDTAYVVRGRFVHTVTNGSSTVATLRSDPFDVVLNPDGTVQAHFTYVLPTGNYDVTSAFEAS